MSDRFGWADYLVLVSMLVISTLIGLFFAWKDRKNTNEDEYLRGGKHMAVIPVSISIMASFLPSTAFIGYPTVIYAMGTTFSSIMLMSLVAAIVSCELFIPIFYNMNLGSVNEYLLKRFNSKSLQVIANLSVLLASMPYFGVEIFAPAIALSVVTEMSITASVFLIGGIVTIYTTMGGLKGVIWTDLFQFSIMVFGLMAVVVRGANVSGGMTEAFKKAHTGGRIEFWNMDFDIYSVNSFWTIMSGMGLFFIGMFTTSQMQVQRAVCMPSLASAKRALYCAIPGYMTIQALVFLSGLIMYAHFYDCEPLLTGRVTRTDQLMPFFVLDIFEDDYKGLPGAYVACIFASSLSSLSSGLNSMASIVWDDYGKKLFQSRFSDKYNVFGTRFLAALIGIVSLGMAFAIKESDNIAEAVIGIYGSFLGPMFAVFFLAIFIPWTNMWGAISGLVVGQAIGYWAVIGWVADKREPSSLMLAFSTEGCLAKNISVIFEGLPLSVLTDYKIPEYHPKGVEVIHHISPFFIPFFGFAISVAVGNVVSLATLANKNTKVNVNLVSYKICFYLEKVLPKGWRQIQEQIPSLQITTAAEPMARVKDIGTTLNQSSQTSKNNEKEELYLDMTVKVQDCPVIPFRTADDIENEDRTPLSDRTDRTSRKRQFIGKITSRDTRV